MNGYREQKVKYTDSTSVEVLENNVYRPGVMCNYHWHDYYELLYITGGRARQFTGGEMVEIEAGDLVLIKPGVEHSTVATHLEGCTILVVLFYLHGMNYDNVLLLQSQHVLPFLGHGMENAGSISRIGRDNPNIRNIAEGILEESENKLSGYETVVKGFLYQILGYMIRDNCFDATPAIPQEQINVISRACAYIEANYSQDISLENVARYIGFTPQYTSRLFKQVVGRNFKAYCDFVRMREAERILFYERLSIPEVAERMGYKSSSEFLRTYKRVYRCTPKEKLNRNCLI